MFEIKPVFFLLSSHMHILKGGKFPVYKETKTYSSRYNLAFLSEPKMATISCKKNIDSSCKASVEKRDPKVKCGIYFFFLKRLYFSDTVHKIRLGCIL